MLSVISGPNLGVRPGVPELLVSIPGNSAPPPPLTYFMVLQYINSQDSSASGGIKWSF